MISLVKYQLLRILDVRRLCALAAALCLSLGVFLYASRPFDPAGQRLIEADLYGREYFFEAVFFIKLSIVALSVFTAGAMAMGEDGAGVLLYGCSKRTLASSKLLAVVGVILLYVVCVCVLLFAVYRGTPYRPHYHPGGSLIGGLLLFGAFYATLASLVGLWFRHLYAQYALLLVFFLTEIPVDPLSSSAQANLAARVANGVLVNLHLLKGDVYAPLSGWLHAVTLTLALALAYVFTHTLEDF